MVFRGFHVQFLSVISERYIEEFSGKESLVIIETLELSQAYATSKKNFTQKQTPQAKNRG